MIHNFFIMKKFYIWNKIDDEHKDESDIGIRFVEKSEENSLTLNQLV